MSFHPCISFWPCHELIYCSESVYDQKLSNLSVRLILGALSRVDKTVAVEEEVTAAADFPFLLFADYIFMAFLVLGEEPIGINPSMHNVQKRSDML